jgi:hypothetical protein
MCLDAQGAKQSGAQEIQATAPGGLLREDGEGRSTDKDVCHNGSFQGFEFGFIAVRSTRGVLRRRSSQLKLLRSAN